jgi:hypothetical protein
MLNKKNKLAMNGINEGTQSRSVDKSLENNGNEKDNGNNGNKKIAITVIVSGTPTTVDANPRQKLHVIAEKALNQTGNTGRPLADWTLKTREGATIDLEKTVDDYNLTDGAQLVMSLEAGVGGC